MKAVRGWDELLMCINRESGRVLGGAEGDVGAVWEELEEANSGA